MIRNIAEEQRKYVVVDVLLQPIFHIWLVSKHVVARSRLRNRQNVCIHIFRNLLNDVLIYTVSFSGLCAER